MVKEAVLAVKRGASTSQAQTSPAPVGAAPLVSLAAPLIDAATTSPGTSAPTSLVVQEKSGAATPNMDRLEPPDHATGLEEVLVATTVAPNGTPTVDVSLVTPSLLHQDHSPLGVAAAGDLAEVSSSLVEVTET